MYLPVSDGLGDLAACNQYTAGTRRRREFRGQETNVFMQSMSRTEIPVLEYCDVLTGAVARGVKKRRRTGNQDKLNYICTSLRHNTFPKAGSGNEKW